ncbi:hypothetical protein UlMin_044859 [Ulmus minor]
MIIVVYLFLLLSFTSTVKCAVYDVTKYGAKPNSDITQALANAWKDACATTSATKIVVPKGTYKLTRASFVGPCKAPIDFQFEGTLQAPSSPSGFKAGDGWVTFGSINSLRVFGGGTFDGQGKASWGKHCQEGNYCSQLPINVRFDFITNSLISSITSLDSKQFHINVLGANNVTFQNLRIIAPAESINTDGIHIGRSTKVTITNSNIQTGDDCISIGDGSKQTTITNINCGPGHGISVGSLGKYPKEDPVEGLVVSNCNFKNTDNGVRIKTWPGTTSYPGAVSDLRFENINMQNVGIPILIDQEYCPWKQCNLKTSSKVKINKVSFKGISGTCSTPVAVKLVCSSGNPCQNVELGNINLKYNGKDGPAKFICKNVLPKITGKVNPPSCGSKARKLA